MVFLPALCNECAEVDFIRRFVFGKSHIPVYPEYRILRSDQFDAVIEPGNRRDQAVDEILELLSCFFIRSFVSLEPIPIIVFVQVF